jgi:hypothetical protein
MVSSVLYISLQNEKVKKKMFSFTLKLKGYSRDITLFSRAVRGDGQGMQPPFLGKEQWWA